jgi:hypothetical protein
MPGSSFTVTPTPPTTLRLAVGQEGRFFFTVTVLSAPDKDLDVMLRAFLDRDGKREEVSWLSVDPEGTQSMAGGSTKVVTVVARPTNKTARGENRIVLAVYDNDRPHDSYVYSSPVICDVPGAGPPDPPQPPGPRSPWWPIAALAAALLLGVVAVVLAWTGRSKPVPPPPTPPKEWNPWVACGEFDELRKGAVKCEHTDFPVDQYEYGFKYNGIEVHVADCLTWNVGLRLVNRDPYMVNSDDPMIGSMQRGGAIWYTETNAADDDIPSACPSNSWRHRYWRIANGNVLLDLGSNGCTKGSLYCRRR